MNQFAIALGTDVHFHAKVPLIPFPRLMHLGIPGFALVLCRRRGMEDRRVNHGAALNQQSTRLQNVGNYVHHLRRQFVVFQ